MKEDSGRTATTLAQEVDRLILDLARSLWAELGADGAVRRHDWQAIDLEPLIIFTAQLGSADSRLCASTIDWCVSNARFASAFRLRNLAEQASAPAQVAFGRYASTVRAHAKVPWPGQGAPLTMLHPDRTGSPDLRRPSLIQLRLRALVGVSARAEILKLMLANPEQPQAASALAEDAGYGKGSVAQALDMLTMAGIVQVQPDSNRLLYRLSRPGDLAQALRWLPSVFPDWWPIFKIIEAIADYAHKAIGSLPARAASVQKVLQRIDPDLHRLGLADQVPLSHSIASAAEFDHWALGFLADQAGRTEVATAAREVTYVIHHLSFGGWLGTINEAGRQPVAFGTEPAEVDERTGASNLAHMMFKSVLHRGRRPNAHPSADEALIQVISREFAEELVRPMRAGQEATFTSEFVRRWYENRRQRFGATA